VIVVWPPPKGTRPAVFLAGSLIVKMAGAIQERLVGRHTRDSLVCAEGLGLFLELPY